jgi:hypothetical protein
MLPTSDTLGGIPQRVTALRARYAERDLHNLEVQAARRGNIEQIAPDMFNETWRKPIVANLIETSARDVAGMLAPLPAFNCSAASGISDKAKSFADRRTKILRSYIYTSNLEVQMLDGADQYNSYGMLVLCIEPDFETNSPRWVVEDAVGAYPVWDKFRRRTVEFARVFYQDYFSLEAEYPEMRQLRKDYTGAVHSNEQVQVVKYVSDKRVVLYLPQMGNYPLVDIANPLGECYYVCARRPSLDTEIRGAYDDVVWIQLARHRMQMLAMEGTEKAIRAPLVVTPDVGDVPVGPDAVITAQNGVQSIGRARLDIPPQAFGAIDQLRQEQQLGAMSPEGRSGMTDASVITGKGLQQLAAGFNTQIATGQTVIKDAFKQGSRISFMMDEKLFGDMTKEIRGNDNGVPYRITYTPKKDIAGDYSTDISYGAAAGLDPNRSLVFLLQSDGAGLLSKDYIRRNLPIDLNAVEEERKIAVEQTRLAVIQSMDAMAQAIPQMAAGGQDPSPIVAKLAKFVQLIQNGKTVEDAAAQAMAPEPPPAQPETPGMPTTDGSAPGDQAAPGAPAPPDQAGALPMGMNSPAGSGRPALQQLMAGLRANGSPTLAASVTRNMPTGA